MAGLQDIAVLVTVLAAASYVVLRLRRSVAGKGGNACAGCTKCSAESGAPRPPSQGAVVAQQPARYDGPFDTQRNPQSTDDHGHSAAR